MTQQTNVGPKTSDQPIGTPLRIAEECNSAELATLAEIGRSILQAQLSQDELCELIYDLAGRIVPTDNFQLGLFEGERYLIKVWRRDGERQTAASFPAPAGQGIIAWLRDSRQPLLVHDFEVELPHLPARPSYVSRNPPRSGIYLPMLAGDTVIGAISIQSNSPDAFNESHLRLLQILANQSSSALNNARLYERSQQQLNDLKAVSDLGRRLTRILDLNELLGQVVELIQARFGYYHVQIFLTQRGSDRAYFRASTGHEVAEKWLREGRSMLVGQEGIIGWVAEKGEMVLANDVSVEPRYVPDDPHLLPDTRAEIALPLLVEGEVLGVLDVQSNQTDAFGHNDILILQTLADQVAVAVSSARAYEAQREEAWATNVILQVAESTSRADGMEGVLDAAVRVTAMLAGVESCSIWLWDEEFEAFLLSAEYGLERAAPEDGSLDRGERATETLRFPHQGWPALDRVRLLARTELIDMSSAECPGPVRDRFAGDRILLLPLISMGSAFGVLGASFVGEHPRLADERRLGMMQGITHQVAAALENSRLTAAYEAEAWISMALLEVAETLRRLQPSDVTLGQVARLAPVLTGVDRCAVLLRDAEGNYRVRTVHAVRPGLADIYRDVTIAPGDLPLLDEACRIGQALVVDDVRGNVRVPEAWSERFGTSTILVVPLLVADEPIGALLADAVGQTHVFSPRRVRILSGIANQTALALENVRLQAQEAERAGLARELELAHDIQRGLLPMEDPSLPGYEIVHRWRSAREVGGDFFDFIRLSRHRLGLVVADVSDKGIPAALFMVFTRTLLRAVAQSLREPAATLERTNELVVTDSTTDMFVTVHYGVLDVINHTLTYASAGHNLAVLVPADGSDPEPLITAGIPLGIVAPVTIGQKSLYLQPGDVVLFYTDGVTEALGPEDEEFGQQRLMEVLRRHRSESADEIATAVEAAVHDFASPTSQHDDLTLLLVKREDHAD